MEYLIIKSEDRQWGTIADANYDLHNLLENTKKIELLSFTMLNAIYNINSENNQIHIVWENPPLTFNLLDYTITHGIYDIDSLVAEINSTINNDVCTVSYDLHTFRITFTNGTGNFHLNWGALPDNTMADVLGFEKQYMSGSASYTGSQPFNLSVIDEIYVHIYEFGVNYNAASSLCLSTFVIPVEVNSGELINYKSRTMFPQSISLDNKTLKNIRIVLKDKNGQILDPNNQNFTMILKAHCSK
jgi:hypothetical protein